MITICITTSTLMVSIQAHKLNIYIMMWLLETIKRYLQYRIYKSIWKLVPLFQILQLIAQRPIASIYEKTQSAH